MAKIVQTLTRASSEYEEDVAQSLVRDLDAVLEKLNTTFQEELKQEIEARARAIALTISNTAVDTSWKLGTFRLDIHAGGRR